jgi:hypothetical protein
MVDFAFEEQSLTMRLCPSRHRHVKRGKSKAHIKDTSRKKSNHLSSNKKLIPARWWWRW